MTLSAPEIKIAEKIIPWQIQHGRHDLPWQQTVSPYKVWISEIMLQQTQVNTVIPYYQKFIARFPNLASLAQAPMDDVLALWSGLGYYARARNLHKSAQVALREWGELPHDLEALQSLPGIGRSTAGAIYSLGFKGAAPILDGNVKRVFCRIFAISDWPGERKTLQQLWQLADQQLPSHSIDHYNQGLMDLGASHCSRKQPACDACPVQKLCLSYQQNLQNEIPKPRPKKKLPTKSCQMWWLNNPQGKILLIKRPEQGIWGGLWSLPQQGAGFDLPPELSWLLTTSTQSILDMKHSFTHFHLKMQVQSPDQASCALIPHLEKWTNQASVQWAEPDKALTLGLPTPIRTIIHRIKAP